MFQFYRNPPAILNSISLARLSKQQLENPKQFPATRASGFGKGSKMGKARRKDTRSCDENGCLWRAFREAAGRRRGLATYGKRHIHARIRAPGLNVVDQNCSRLKAANDLHAIEFNAAAPRWVRFDLPQPIGHFTPCICHHDNLPVGSCRACWLICRAKDSLAEAIELSCIMSVISRQEEGKCVELNVVYSSYIVPRQVRACLWDHTARTATPRRRRVLPCHSSVGKPAPNR